MSFCGACLCRTEELHTYELQDSLKTLLQMGHLIICSPCKKMANEAEVFMKNIKFIQTKLNSLLTVTESDLENMVQCLHRLPKDVKQEMKHSASKEYEVEKNTYSPNIKIEVPIIKTELPLCDDRNLKVDLELIEDPEMTSPPKIKVNTFRGSDETFHILRDILTTKTDVKLVNKEHKDTKVTDKLIKKVNMNKRVTKVKVTKKLSNGVGKKNSTITVRANMLKMYCKMFCEGPEDGSKWSSNHCIETTAAHFDVSREVVRSLVKLCKFEETLTRTRKDDVHRDGNDMVSVIKDERNEEYTCPYCPNIFSEMEELLTHIYKLHHRFECHYCAMIFKNKSTIEKHIKRIHAKEASMPIMEEKQYPCRICGKPLSSKSYASNHEKTHSIENKYYCVECDRSFKTDLRLQNHLKSSKAHGRVLPFKCSYCGKGYMATPRLEEHINANHLNIRPYECTTCGKAYVSKRGLVQHMKDSHSGFVRPKNKPCSVCGQKFGTKSILAAHMRIHTGERPFECTLCPSTFRQNAALSTHIKLKHKNKK